MIERFATLDRSQLWLSAVVVAELRFGAVKLALPRFSATVEAWLALTCAPGLLMRHTTMPKCALY